MKLRNFFSLLLCMAVNFTMTGCNPSHTGNISNSENSNSSVKSSLSLETQSDASGASMKSSLNSDIPKTDSKSALASGSSDPKVEEFLSSAEGIDFQAVAKKFTIAYCSGDVQMMKTYLLDPKSIDGYLDTKDKIGDIELVNLKLGPDDVKDNSVHAQYEISKNDGRGNVYLDLQMKRIKITGK
jgi:hypothetical protein